jgi:hypothetical protein
MGAGFPVKANYATGDVLTATNMNDQAGTLNYIDPTGKTNGYVLTRNSSATGGLEWAAAGSGGGGWTLLSTTTLSGSSTSISISDTSYLNLGIIISDWQTTTSTDMSWNMKANGLTSNYDYIGVANYSRAYAGNVGNCSTGDANIGMSYYDWAGNNQANSAFITIFAYADTNSWKSVNYNISGRANNTYPMAMSAAASINTTSAISSIVFSTNQTWGGGTVKVYGIK